MHNVRGTNRGLSSLVLSLWQTSIILATLSNRKIKSRLSCQSLCAGKHNQDRLLSLPSWILRSSQCACTPCLTYSSTCNITLTSKWSLNNSGLSSQSLRSSPQTSIQSSKRFRRQHVSFPLIVTVSCDTFFWVSGFKLRSDISEVKSRSDVLYTSNPAVIGPLALTPGHSALTRSLMRLVRHLSIT